MVNENEDFNDIIQYLWMSFAAKTARDNGCEGANERE